jgi:phosphatidylglycerol---prolipoprotein diacylglyceryl transferase
MHPRLFTIGPVTVYSYGLMLGIGFIAASILLTKELRRKGLDQNLGGTITFLAMVFGIAGSKILYLIENWEYFVRAPFEMTFSPGGLTWYGGFILATITIMMYARRKKVSFLKICDAAAPGLLLAYGIARIGCHLAGDGDYGMPTNVPWAAVYSNGTYPPSVAFRDFPEIVQRYGVNGIVPDTTPVHPAPLYEFIIGVGLFFLLWKFRLMKYPDGKLFMIYLILSGAARFAVEFIRINPRILWGLSEAQLFALVMIALGLYGIWFVDKRLVRQAARPEP